MKSWRQRLCSRSLACTLWIALCFGITSAVYLSWLHRLVAVMGGAALDWITMVLGYLLQAAGVGAACLLLRRNPAGNHPRWFTAILLLFALVCLPTLLSDSPAGVVWFGLIANLLCGVIAGFYLYGIVRNARAGRRSHIFGGGYAVATIAVGLPALFGRSGLLNGRHALLLYVPLCAALALATARLHMLDATENAPTMPHEPAASSETGLALACVVVVLLSAVKNMGFSFPSVDIEAGLIPALSRLPYAVGLAVAGIINDRSRRNGMICTVAALIIPFILLGLNSEPVPAAIFWGLEYLFFGFFSVFRVVLFLDLAGRARRWELAPLGLLMGRLGDVAGTAASLLLAGSKIALIAATAIAFFPTVFLFFRLYQKLYEPEALQQRSEQEVFEAFCLHNDLSAREREVLRMVLDNHSNGEIAETLFISGSTVKYHVRNVLQKAGCKNRSELQKKFKLALYPHLESTARVFANGDAD